MTTYVCTNMICQNKATYKGVFSGFGKKICLKCASTMAKEGSSKLKTASGSTPVPHVGKPKLPEPPLHGTTGGASGPPRVDLTQLSGAVNARQVKSTTNALVSNQLVYKMTPPGAAAINYNMAVKYHCWKSGLAKQDLEFTIKIPVKVYSGSAAKTYWESKGYASDAFDKTVWGDHLGVRGATFTDEVRKQWTAKANKAWGNAGVLWTPPKKAALLYRLRFEFVVVDDASKAAACVACVETTGAAHTHCASGTIDAVRWGINDIDPDTYGPICHEVGHLIGNPDEYYTIEYEGKTVSWGEGYQHGMGIMNNPDNPPLIRNFKPLALEIAKAFNIPLDEAEIVENIAMPSSSKKHKLNAHIWP